jgi:hypothetical protein
MRLIAEDNAPDSVLAEIKRRENRLNELEREPRNAWRSYVRVESGGGAEDVRRPTDPLPRLATR